MIWSNYFVTTLRATSADGHIFAASLRDVIKNHDGSEAYHCAYDLEERKDFKNYDGLMRPALGYVWFDFDSHDGGLQALSDTRRFVAWLEVPDVFICYSGSKGFHVGVPFGYFGMEPSAVLGATLHRLANVLKKTYPSLDTTIYNANRKFRALGSKHPKTGLYKIHVRIDEPFTIGDFKASAKERCSLDIPVPELRSPLERITSLLAETTPKPEAPAKGNTKEKVWIAPTGEAAFSKCSFLAHVKAQPAQISEPQWYAAISIVSRFQEGRKQCHGISCGHPKYSVSECNEKIDQAEKESAPRTCANIATLWEGCASCPLSGKVNSPVNIFDTRFWIHGDKGKLFPDFNSLLNEFCNRNAYKTIADMKTVYVYNGTHYEEYTPIEIKGFAEEAFEPKPKEKERQEFAHKVFANSIAKRSFFTETTVNKINFRNGVLCLETKSLSQHSSECGFRGVLPYDFTPNARAPLFEAWINDVMLGDEALVAILQEFMGYIIRGGEYTFHKALWLAGSGRNGKSTFLDVIKALLGAQNYSALSIKQIIKDKFAASDLDGRLANFSEETSPEDLTDSGTFKNLTGDGDISAQKKYGDIYSFRNRAKLIMTYNEVPILKDLSPGMLSRPIIIPWKKDLSDETKQDKTLKSKLLAELPGIFNFALRGWERLEAQKAFTFSAKTQLSLREIESASCSATRWIEEQVIFLSADHGKTYDGRGLYTAYKGWHSEGGGQAMGEMKFLKRLNAHPEIKQRVRHSKKGNEYFGMRIGEKTPEEVSF